MLEQVGNKPDGFVESRDGDSLGRAQYYVDQLNDKSLVSDGYHTFGDLYKHRNELFIALAKAHFRDPMADEPWISRKHQDGSEIPGWFLMGIGDRPGKQISYHLPEEYWDICSKFAKEIPSAIFFDGHTSDDVLKRLAKL